MWVADISKANELLGWRPARTLEEGLTKYVRWIKNTSAKII